MQHYDFHYADLLYSIDGADECGHFVAVALRSYCRVLRAGEPDAPGNRRVPVDVSESRGAKKQESRVAVLTRNPALRFASRAACRQPSRLPITLENSLGRLVTVTDTSNSSTNPSIPSQHDVPRWWCSWCGDNLPSKNQGRPALYCSEGCAHDDMVDAEHADDRVRFRRAYLAKHYICNRGTPTGNAAIRGQFR